MILIEARDRVGGRVWWEEPARDGVVAELGAEFIHGPARETKALLRDAGIGTVEPGGDSWVCSQSGELQRTDFDFASVSGIFDAARELPGDVSVEQYLRRFDGDGAKRAKADLARAFAEGFDAADPAIASARSIADEWGSGVDFASVRPLGGYGPIVGRMRDACAAAGVETFLSTIVRRVSWRPRSVTVDARGTDGKSLTIHARAAVVTLPVGVLRHRGDDMEVVFEPVLPPAKLDALQSIAMGSAARVALWFRTAFWEQMMDGRYRNAGFFRCPEQPFPTYWTQLPLRSMLVVAWAGGPKASALQGVSEADRIERALTGFGAMFGDPALARKEFEHGVTHDWDLDPFSRGAYSYVIVGGGDARAAFAATVDDTLYFAGEAVSIDGQGGTVNGALETGERAARDAAISLGTTAK